MDTLVFIDTNIFLDFYRDRGRDQIPSLLKHVDNNHNLIITTNQVEMEFKKNRQNVILDTMKLLTISDLNRMHVPNVLGNAKVVETLETQRKDLSKTIKTIKSRFSNILQDPDKNDEIYKLSLRLFNNTNDINLSRDKTIRFTIRRLACKRFMLGYPPRKKDDTSIGDAINWEWSVHCAQIRKANIVIVSRDSDYGITWNNKSIINDWLEQEFKERTSRKRKVILTDRLTEAFKIAKIQVTKKEIAEEEKLIQEIKDEKISEMAGCATVKIKGSGDVQTTQPPITH